jgi:hypothetical protein
MALGTGPLRDYDNQVMKWLDALLKRSHSASNGCGFVAGFVVTERATGRTVHREMLDLSNFGVKKAVFRVWTKRQRLEWKYNPRHYEVEDIMFNTKRACERYFQD